MLRDIEIIFRENCQLNFNRPILIGVSGGPDSLCLLESLHQAGYKIILAYFNHQLRIESATEASGLKEIAAEKKISSVFGTGDVRKFSETEKLSLEEAARILRYRFLFEQAREHDVQAVAVGHTADDQVETVLMHFLRGAGLNGLQGMRYRTLLPEFDRHIPIVRPLLDVRRREIVAYCAANGLQPYHDSSNDSLDFKRNRIRHRLIPELERYNPRISETILRTSKSLAGDYEIISAVLSTAWKECVTECCVNIRTDSLDYTDNSQDANSDNYARSSKSERQGIITFNANLLKSYSRGLQQNLIRRALNHLTLDTGDIRFSVVDRAAKFILENKSGVIDLSGGIRMFREGDFFFLAQRDADLPVDTWPQMPDHQEILSLPIPGQLNLAGGWHMICEQWDAPVHAMEKRDKKNDPFQVWLDADCLPKVLEVRTRRPGDRFAPFGLNGHTMKLSDFFINEKIPARARNGWPLLCTRNAVVWIPGVRPAHPFCITEKTGQIIHFALSKLD